MKTIAVEAAIEAAKNNQGATGSDMWSTKDVVNFLSTQANDTNTEYAPVVYGTWLLESPKELSNGGYEHYCSECNDYYTSEADSLRFCPRCGARMTQIENPAQYGRVLEFVGGQWKHVRGLIHPQCIEPNKAWN